jgi:hypothetical protein
MSVASDLRQLAERWSGARAAERANAQSYLKEPCRALAIEEPRPAGSGYEFELAVRTVSRDGTEVANFIDLYKRDCFALEAKDEAEGASNDRLLLKAFGQVRNYANALPSDRPPYILVMDVARTLILWDRWSGDYGGFNAGRRPRVVRPGGQGSGGRPLPGVRRRDGRRLALRSIEVLSIFLHPIRPARRPSLRGEVVAASRGRTRRAPRAAASAHESTLGQ